MPSYAYRCCIRMCVVFVGTILQNPCSERIPENIKDTTVNCTNLPSLLIVGPQKTGSTALHFFLQAHPLLKANYPGENFEEVQFFSNHKLYLKGVEWYAIDYM